MASKLAAAKIATRASTVNRLRQKAGHHSQGKTSTKQAGTYHHHGRSCHIASTTRSVVWPMNSI